MDSPVSVRHTQPPRAHNLHDVIYGLLPILISTLYVHLSTILAAYEPHVTEMVR